MNEHRGKELCEDVGPFVQSSPSFSRRSRGLVFLLAALLIGAAAVSAQSRHITLSDFAKIVSVSDTQISPDGKTIVVVVGRANLEQDRNERELVQIDTASGAQHPLTYERKTAGSPRWSPNGNRLAFTANDGTGRDAKPQIFVLRLPDASWRVRRMRSSETGQYGPRMPRPCRLPPHFANDPPRHCTDPE